jgi:hypothetical protein
VGDWWLDGGRMVPPNGCRSPGEIGLTPRADLGSRIAGRGCRSGRFRQERLRLIGWHLFTVASFTNWCGHGQEFIPLPDDDGWVRLVPVWDQMTRSLGEKSEQSLQ